MIDKVRYDNDTSIDRALVKCISKVNDVITQVNLLTEIVEKLEEKTIPAVVRFKKKEEYKKGK